MCYMIKIKKYGYSGALAPVFLLVIIKCMHKSIWIKCNNPTKNQHKSLHLCEDWKNTLTLSLIHSPLSKPLKQTQEESPPSSLLSPSSSYLETNTTFMFCLGWGVDLWRGEGVNLWGLEKMCEDTWGKLF